jgi:tRNA(Arg) A34 adenosine deaminase TadA
MNLGCSESSAKSAMSGCDNHSKPTMDGQAKCEPNCCNSDTDTIDVANDNEFDAKFMDLAASLSSENIDNGGGPFGAVIVKDGEIIATGVNSVTRNNDPTAHAEVSAVRAACQKLGSFQLQGCIVYSSCEPCPMCLSALYWAGVKKIYFGNTKDDADAIDFSDKFIYEEIDKAPRYRSIPGIRVDKTQTIKAFEKWAAKEDKIKY